MFSDFFSSTIPGRIQVVAILSSLLLLGYVVQLIRKEKLKEGYSIIWFVVGISLVLFASVTRLLDVLARFVGIAYSPAAFFLVLTAGLLVLALHFSILVSKHDRLIRELAQENALLKDKLDQKIKEVVVQEQNIGVQRVNQLWKH